MRSCTSLVITLLFFITGNALASPNSLTYQGRILKSDGTPLEYNNVSFLFEITNPAGTCVIYREQKDGVNMVNSGGVFDVPIGTGTKLFPTSPTKTLLSVFDNTQNLDCGDANNNVSSTYTPAQGHSRLLRVQFFDGTGWKVISPDNEIRTVPFAAFAQSAQTLGNKTENDFILKTGVPTCNSGTYLSYDGSSLYCAAVSGAAGGTVTNVTASAPLSVVNGTSTPSLSITQATGSTDGYLSSTDWTTFNNKQPAGNYITALTGDVTASGPNTAVATVAKLQGSPLTIISPSSGQFLKYNGTAFVNSALSSSDIPSLDWSKITTGKPTTLSGYGITDSLVLNAGGTPSIQTGLDTSKPTTPAAGAIYFATDSKVIYQYNSGAWISIASATGSGGTITGVTAGTGLSGGGTSGAVTLNLANTTVTAGSYTRANITVDAQGRLTAASNGANINLGTEVTGTLPIANGGTGATTSLGAFNLLSPLTTKGDLLAFDGTNNIRVTVGTNGQVLSADSTQASGLKWVTPTNGTVTNVTGTAPIVVSNGSTTPAISVSDATASSKGVVQIGAGIAVTSGTISADPANFPSAVPVSKGGTGSTTMTANRLVASDGTGSSYIPFNCGVGQVITFNASGVAGCTSFTAAGFFINGGNSFGANASLGTNDAYTLSFKTNNSVAMTIDTTGNVGIGNSTPAYPLDTGIGNIGTGTRIDFSLDGANNAFLRARGSGTDSQRISYGFNADPTSGLINFVKFNTNGTERLRIDSAGNVGIGTSAPSVSLDLGSKTDALRLPAGTTAQKPSSPANGMLRYNSTTNLAEIYQNGAWVNLTTSAGGSNVSTSSTGAVTIAAGGTNQNVTLQASGTGVVTSPSVMTLTSGQASTSSSSGALVVTGGIGLSGDMNAGGNIVAGGSVGAAGFHAAQGAPNNADSSTNGFSFTPDGDTGMFSPGSGSANGVIAFFSNNAEKMRIAGNYVGIGTSSPSAKLHISDTGSSWGAPKVLIQNTAASDQAVLGFKNAAATTPYDWEFAAMNGNGALYLQDYQNSVNKMILFPGTTGNLSLLPSGGNVGIGSSNPISLLQIGGSNYSTSSWTTQGSQLYIPGVTVTDTTGSGTIANRVVASIGTHTLAASSAETITNAASFYIASAPSAGSNVTITNPLAFLVGANNSAFLGNVGIGTTNPGATLHLYGASSAPFLRFSYNSSTSYTDFLESGTTQMKIQKVTASGSPQLDFNPIPSDGTSGAYIRMFRETNTAGGKVIQVFKGDGSTSVDSQIGVGFNSYFNASGGNVGIGTSTPVTTLEVVETSGATNRGVTSTTYATNPGGLLQTRGARGTPAAPAAIQSSDTFGWLAMNGYDGTAFSVQAQPTGVSAAATENWSSTAHGAALRFTTTTNGNINGAERMRIDHNGNIGVGTASPLANIHIAGGGTGNSAYSSFQMGADATASNNFHWVNENNGGRNLRLYNGNLGSGAALMSVSSIGNVTLGESGSSGAGILSLKPGSNDHVYIQFFGRTASPTVRSGYIGIPAAGATSMNIANEMSGGIIDFKTNNGGTYQDAATLSANGNFWVLGTYSNGSDRRLKKDIEPLQNNLDKVLQLNPVSYHWKDPHADPKLQTGFIAQEIEEVYPHVVSEGKNGMKGVSYTSLIAPLTGAIQELYHKVQALFANHEDRLARLETQMSELQKQNSQLQKQNEELLKYIKSQNEKTKRIPANADK